MRRKLRRLKRKVQEHATPKKIGITFGVIVLVVLAVFLINTPSSKSFEVTEVDVISLSNVHASKISVKGVMLGDSLETVIAKIGHPDQQRLFPPNIINIEYGKQLGLKETGIIIHFVDDAVKRITLKKPFNEFLVGKTKIANSKTEILNALGVPDSIEKVPVSQGSALLMNLYSFEDRGIEILVRKQEQNAVSFVA
tara:strand:+ start:17691 stop:18278 length:588 start_codon:yes stop_codon:yes gene_type:complete